MKNLFVLSLFFLLPLCASAQYSTDISVTNSGDGSYTFRVKVDKSRADILHDFFVEYAELRAETTLQGYFTHELAAEGEMILNTKKRSLKLIYTGEDQAIRERMEAMGEELKERLSKK